MRGVLVKEWTEFENLAVEDCPRPALQPGQLRIKTQAAGISFATSLVVSGRYQRKPPLPFTPGTEAAGVVIEVADGVTEFEIGDGPEEYRIDRHALVFFNTEVRDNPGFTTTAPNVTITSAPRSSNSLTASRSPRIAASATGASGAAAPHRRRVRSRAPVA